jgi:hypothetical protein
MTNSILIAIVRLLTPWRTIRQLEREVARLEAIIANPYLAGLEIGRETDIEVGLRGSGPQLLAGMFAGLLEKDGANAPNYLEVEFHTHAQGRILVRVQRLHGETPHALRVKAERQAAAWKALCAELVTAVDEASDAVDRTSDCVNAANHPELWVQCVDLIRRQDDLIARARAALSQPEPVPALAIAAEQEANQ